MRGAPGGVSQGAEVLGGGVTWRVRTEAGPSGLHACVPGVGRRCEFPGRVGSWSEGYAGEDGWGFLEEGVLGMAMAEAGALQGVGGPGHERTLRREEPSGMEALEGRPGADRDPSPFPPCPAPSHFLEVQLGGPQRKGPRPGTRSSTRVRPGSRPRSRTRPCRRPLHLVSASEPPAAW